MPQLKFYEEVNIPTNSMCKGHLKRQHYHDIFFDRLNYMKNKNVLKKDGGSHGIFMTILL